jgi:hypothetical protein
MDAFAIGLVAAHERPIKCHMHHTFDSDGGRIVLVPVQEFKQYFRSF